MARSPRQTPSKARGGRKAPAEETSGPAKKRASTGPGSKKSAPTTKGPARKEGAGSKPTSAKGPGRKRQPQTEGWAATVGALMISDLGREILADVLNAAAVASKAEGAGVRARAEPASGQW